MKCDAFFVYKLSVSNIYGTTWNRAYSVNLFGLYIAPPSFKRVQLLELFSRKGYRRDYTYFCSLTDFVFYSSNELNVLEMLRFLSRRKSKSDKGLSNSIKNPSQATQPVKPNKNIIVCKIIVLDGSDLTIELHVRVCIIILSSTIIDFWISKEKSIWIRIVWTSILFPGSDREGLLWVAVYWCQPCTTLAGPY